MTKSEEERLRRSTLYENEELYVIYKGKGRDFPKDTPILATPKMICKSGLPYPKPKWMACDYYITDNKGNDFLVARGRFGKLKSGFEWVI